MAWPESEAKLDFLFYAGRWRNRLTCSFASQASSFTPPSVLSQWINGEKYAVCHPYELIISRDGDFAGSASGSDEGIEIVSLWVH